MILSADALATITGSAINSNARSVLAGLERGGHRVGLQHPHRLAMYLAQILHESGGFRYDQEVWGPTAAQARYDTRTDLGNTPERDGDGERYKGRGPIQVTGRSNYGQFTAWAQSWAPDAPDFVAEPQLVTTDPWEGLSPIWYWETRDLNRYADAGDLEMVTRRINGGLNGYADRCHWYTRAGLVLSGRAPGDVAGFQKAAGLEVDGVAGPRTRAALHTALRRVKPAPATAPASDPLAALIEALLAFLRRIGGPRHA